jgi:hypothetical protein
MTTEFGCYKGGRIYISFDRSANSSYSMGMSHYSDIWYLPFEGTYPFEDPENAYSVKNVHFSVLGRPLEAQFNNSMRPLQYAWRKNVKSRKRSQERCAAIKEELMAAAWHPRRVAAWLEAGIETEDM